MSAVHPLPALPPLQNGDVLTREEFEARYHAMPDLKKAELIEGVVYLPSPVSLDHAEPDAMLMGWVMIYQFATSALRVGDNGSVRLNWRSVPQPDVMLFIREELGGQARVDSDRYVAGAPELVAEIAATSASYDLNVKMDVYRRSGVREYLVWRVLDGAFDWFVLREGRYERRHRDADGILRSEVFPGLWPDPEALLSEDLPRLMGVVQQGIASEEHQDFVRKLAARAEKA